MKIKKEILLIFEAKQVESVLLGVAVGYALGVPVEFQPRGTFKITDMVGFGSQGLDRKAGRDTEHFGYCQDQKWRTGVSCLRQPVNIGEDI
jgi:hypothetical protein